MKKSYALFARRAATATIVATVVVAASQSAHAQYTVQTVMTGLNNARGMAFGADGNLYVAEAGNGGTGTSIVGGDGTTIFYGSTAGISQLNLSTNTQSRVLSGGPSLAAADGSDAVGINGITFIGNQAYGVIGYGGDPTKISSFSETGASHLDKLVSFSLDGSNTITNVADLGAYETANNPDGVATLNSNPFNLVSTGSGFVVADAGGNDILGVTTGGSISTLSVLSPQSTPPGFVGPPTYEGVPTDVAINPLDGKYYFSQLTGYPFTPGSANIYVYDPKTGLTSVAYTGFTTLTGLTFDASGNLYALEYTTLGIAAPPSSGAIIQISSSGVRTTLIDSGLVAPTSIIYGNGALYVTNNSTSATNSQVLRISATAAAPEPGALALFASAGLAILPIARRKKMRAQA